MADFDDTLVPGPLPPRADNYVTTDPEPWERPWNGERTAHTGANLYGSGYVFKPRPEYDTPQEDLHEDSFRMTMLADVAKIDGIIMMGLTRGFHVHRDQDPAKRGITGMPTAKNGEEWIVVCSGRKKK